MTLATYRRKLPGRAPRVIIANAVQECSNTYQPGRTDSPEMCYDFWGRAIATLPDHEHDKENLVVLMLDTRLNCKCWHRVSIGGLDNATAHPREVFRPAIAAAAYGIVVMHNHPSGDPTPSNADLQCTRRFIEAGELLQIKLHDHVIVGRPSPGRQPYYSFRESGIIA